MSLTTNLVSYYKLSNTSDSVGANTLTNNNSVTFSSGFIGNAANFGNANTNKFLDTTNSVIGFGTQKSFGGWFKINAAITSGTWNLASITTGSIEDLEYQYNLGTPQLVATRYDGTTGNSASYTITLTVGTWYNIMFTWDGSTVILYVNGVNRASVASTITTPGSVPVYPTGFTLGCYSPSGLGQFGSNYTDEIGIWSRLLSPTEVTQLYNNGVGLQYPFNKSGFLMFM